jgi:hypothetical protein
MIAINGMTCHHSLSAIYEPNRLKLKAVDVRNGPILGANCRTRAAIVMDIGRSRVMQCELTETFATLVSVFVEP